MIYLDNAATTKIDPEVLEAMLPYLKDEYGNPGSRHCLGRSAARAVAHAREQVANLMRCDPESVIFTSGGSEANNLVFAGLYDRIRLREDSNIVFSAAEHDSCIKAANRLCDITEANRFEVPVTAGGQIDMEYLCGIIEYYENENVLVSVMAENNETGAANPIGEIAAMCHAYGILFHSDFVQALGGAVHDLDEWDCDFISISSHKIHGPKGVGALIAKDPKTLTPLILGGDRQELGLRGGTENVAGIVGFGKACELLSQNGRDYNANIARTKRLFLNALGELLSPDDYCINVPSGSSKTVSLRFNGVDSESLLLALDSFGVCVSSGAACSDHESKPNRVLIACGLTPEEARSSVRVSFSRFTSVEEAKEAAGIFAECVKTLKEISSQ